MKLLLCLLVALLLLPGKTVGECLIQQPPPEEKQNPPEGRFIGTLTSSFHDFLIPSPKIGIQFQQGKFLSVILDTGFTGILILPKTAEQLNLKTEEKDTLGKVQAGVAFVPQIYFNAEEARIMHPANRLYNPKGIPIWVGDLSWIQEGFYGTEVRGVMGLEIFGPSTRIRFDFDHQKVEWWDKPTAPYRPKDAIVLPVKVENNRCFIETYLNPETKSDKDAKPIELLIDTGTQGLVVPKSYLTGVKPKALSRRKDRFQTVYGIAPAQPILLETLELGGHKETDVPTLVVDDPQMKHGLLGVQILRRYRVTFDMTYKEVILEKTAAYNDKPSLPGRSLVKVKIKDNVVLIDGWDDALPDEARKKLKKGDQLIAIDKYQVQSNAPRAIDYALAGYAGTEAKLAIQPAGKGEDDWFEITYKRPILYDAP